MAVLDITLADVSIAAFDDVVIEIKSHLTTQIETINISHSSSRPSPIPQFSTGNQCPGPNCPDSNIDTLNLRNIWIILFTIIIILLLILLCRQPRRQRPLPKPGVSPYGFQSPYPQDRSQTDTTFATPYSRTDVSPSRRRQSPVLGRRTPSSSPRGLFSVTQ